MLNNQKALNAPYVPLPNSTLNQKFSLHEHETLNPGQYPSVSYLIIGNKGATYDISTDGIMLTRQIQHEPDDMSLYNMIPFRMVRADRDIPSEERTRYRLRVPTSVRGIDYIAYYALKLDTSLISTVVELRDTSNNNITTSTYEPEPGKLVPTHPSLSSYDLQNPNKEFLYVSSKIEVNLNHADILNIIEACTILYEDPRYANITEMAVCSGADRTLQFSLGGTTSNYVDSICTQINSFIYQQHALTETTTSINLTLDIGSGEPLLVSRR